MLDEPDDRPRRPDAAFWRPAGVAVGSAFTRTDRVLEIDDNHAAGVGGLVALLCLGAWMAWMALAELGVYVVADNGRIEVETTTASVDAPVEGRIVAVRARLADTVRAGEVLFEIDRTAQQLELRQVELQRAAALRELASIRDQIAVEAAAIADAGAVTDQALDVARARDHEAAEAARLARREAERAQLLLGSGALPELESIRAQSAARQREQAALATSLATKQLRAEGRSQRTDRAAHIEQLRRGIVALEGEIEVLGARQERIRSEIEIGRVRAPVDGEIGTLGAVELGTFVDAGERLAVVVPPGALELVGDFAVADAVGRIEPGQLGIVRLHGFPWTQYGTLDGEVAKVATEADHGLIRVELMIRRDTGSRIPVQHGLRGTIEIEVDRVSPLTLVIRAAGRMLTGDADQGV